jgi:alpha-L-fucosidase
MNKILLQCACLAAAQVLAQLRGGITPVTPGPADDGFADELFPEWFRDAKFGIWAHWGPQAVPMEGDWYARKMYQQGSADYKDHLARFGHPSTNGWKDIIPLWKAEKWEPDKLMALYKEAGANISSAWVRITMIFSCGIRRCTNGTPSTTARTATWWATGKKPRKNKVLPFGVTEHLGASFTWFQDAHKSDKTGPLAGVPYDGANSNYWDLYHFPAAPDDKSTGIPKIPRWQQQWFNEIKELVDDYHPDLLYSDGGVAVRQRSGPEPDCQSLQRQPPAQSRQVDGRL